MSTLAGAPLIRARLDVPPSGGWIAAVALASRPVPPLGPAELVIGDLRLLGRVIRAGEDEPDQPAVVIAGGPGWDALLTRRGTYNAPGGVRLSTVLADLAKLAGEAYAAPPEAFLPEEYGWGDDPPIEGRAVLADLVRRKAIPTWRVDPPDGRTRFDPWPDLGPADQLARVLAPRNTTRGIRMLGLDRAVARLLPGSTIEGAKTRRLTVFDKAGSLTAIAREQ